MSDIRAILNTYLSAIELPSHEQLLSLLECGISVLEGESASYRPLDSFSKAGGLLDFSPPDFTALPLVLVPDLHGRGKFLLDLLDFKIGGESVLELLSQGKIIVCCLGDIFHSENRGRFRWKKAFEEYSRGNTVNPSLVEEMRENISLLEMLLTLKSAFASHFHILKGNHENVLNEHHPKMYGNYPFRKFCDEGNMVADFIQSFYDDLILHEISCFEKILPVCAVFPGQNCIVSHAEPLDFYSRRQLIDYHSPESTVVLGLTWPDGTVQHLFDQFFKEDSSKSFYFTGHRPVLGTYALRQGGRLVQIHNPEIEQIALLYPKKEFNPEIDIINVEITKTKR